MSSPMQLSPKTMARQHLSLTPPHWPSARGADRASSGSPQPRSPCSPMSPISPLESSGSKDRESSLNPGLTTGNSSWPSMERLHSLKPDPFSQDAIWNCPAPPQRPHTSGKTLPGYPVPNSNMEPNLFRQSNPSYGSEMPKLNGKPSGPPPKLATSRASPQAFEYNLIGPLNLLAPIMPALYLLCAEPIFSKGLLVVENPTALGLKLHVVTLKTHGPSGGRDTKVRKMLSSMSFEEALTSRTSSDGLTTIRSWWKPKAELYHYLQIESSSPPTLALLNGMRNST